MLGRRWWVGALFFLLPMLVYALILTKGTGNFFAPTYGWHAYNELALSIADGRTDVPADAIGAEGMYINGHVYFYYGILPSLLRLALMPFVDLHVVPVSNLLVWLMLITGQSALQVAMFRAWRAAGKGPLVLIFASIALWFSSGAFLIAGNASIYHEPYAAAVMLAEIAVAMLATDILVHRRELSAARLIGYALLAGLSLFTRQTFGVGLYIIAVGLLWPSGNDVSTLAGRLLSGLRRSVVPLLVMLVAGLTFLSLGHARTGHYGAGWSVNNYGYYLIGDDRPRLVTMRDQQFSPVRIVPNLLYTLTGGAHIRERVIKDLGGGRVKSYFAPVRYIMFAPCTLVIAAFGAMSLWRRALSGDPRRLVVTAGLAFTALLQMSYGTMNWRYTAELWPMLAWFMLCAVADPGFDLRAGTTRKAWLGALIAMTVLSLSYGVYLIPTLQKGDRNLSTGSLEAPLVAVLANAATAPGSRDPTIPSASWPLEKLDPLKRIPADTK